MCISDAKKISGIDPEFSTCRDVKNLVKFMTNKIFLKCSKIQ